MNFLQKIKPEWVLRISLGLMYVYSGMDIIRNPKSWTWAVIRLPQIIQKIIGVIGTERYLMLQGIGELSLAFLFLLWFFPRKFVLWATALAAMEITFILLLVRIDSITFRDMGVLGAVLALFIIYLRKEKNNIIFPEGAKPSQTWRSESKGLP